MKRFNGAVLGFHHLSAAWYGPTCLKSCDYSDQIMIGFYHKGDGTEGEFAIRWHNIGRKQTPRLEAFDDAWLVLSKCTALMKALAAVNGRDLGPLEMCEVLKGCGVKDLTERTNPYSTPSKADSQKITQPSACR